MVLVRSGSDRPARESATEAFLDDVALRGRQPLLRREKATIRLDLVDGPATKHMFVRIDKGVVSVSKRGARPDATMRAERTVFDGIAEGRVNPTAALLRGALVIEGDLGVATGFARLFPGPPGSQRASLERDRNERDE
jgi:putative sterol carrier protein